MEKKWTRYQHLALQLQGTLTQKSRKGMDQKTALASVQEEEEMTVDSN